MKSDIAELEILDMGLEDVMGLYEIIWRFNTIWPTESIGKKYQVADEVFRRLLNQQAVRIVRQRFGPKDTLYEPIPEKEVDALLSSPVGWYPSLPDDPKVQIGYKTSTSGEERYKELYEKTKKA